MQLTEKEKRLVRKLSHPRWPRVTFYAGIISMLFGGIAIAISIKDCLKLYHAPDLIVQPANMAVFSEAWACLVTGAIWLMAGIGLWMLRSFGLVIRKLAENNNGANGDAISKTTNNP